MVWTANQTNAFFEHANQMAIPCATVSRLQAKGLTTVKDLSDLDKETLKQIVENLRWLGGTIKDPNPNAKDGATIPTLLFIFGAKSQLHLKAAIQIAQYPSCIGRKPTVSNIKWDPVIKNFTNHWKTLKERKDNKPDVPKITKSLPIIEWSKSFADYLQQVIGAWPNPGWTKLAVQNYDC